MVDPDPFERRLYTTAKEAAAALGVSIPTLYAYVSRGFIRSQGVAGSRNRRYWKWTSSVSRAGGFWTNSVRDRPLRARKPGAGQ